MASRSCRSSTISFASIGSTANPYSHKPGEPFRRESSKPIRGVHIPLGHGLIWNIAGEGSDHLLTDHGGTSDPRNGSSVDFPHPPTSASSDPAKVTRLHTPSELS